MGVRPSLPMDCIMPPLNPENYASTPYQSPIRLGDMAKQNSIPNEAQAIHRVIPDLTEASFHPH